MWSKYLVILFSLLSLAKTTEAQHIRIKASGEGYENSEFRFYSISDPVTQQLTPLITSLADSSGLIITDIPFYGKGRVIIKTGVYNLSLFAESGKTYELSLPQFAGKTSEDETNPFFKETNLILNVIKDSLCLNNLIGGFENHYNEVYDSISRHLFYNTKLNEIPAFKNELSKYPVTDTIRFYSDYVKCRKSVLDMMTFVRVEEKIAASSFLNDYVDLTNPAYTDLVSQLFGDYFKTIVKEEIKNGISSAIQNGSILQLKEVLIRDGKIKNNKLLEFVIILNIYNGYYGGRYSEGQVIKLLDDVNSVSEFTDIRYISSFVIEKVKRLLPGSIPPSLNLVNQAGIPVSLQDFNGKYILLNFARSDSYPSLSEFSILRMWKNKYDKDLQIVTVLTDDDYLKAVTKLRKDGCNWEILNGSANERLTLLYEIRSFPTFILLSREGKIIAAPVMLPSERLESVISDLILKDNIRSGLVK